MPDITKIVFLDTNIYLHYQPFDQIKWLEILDASKIIIVVPPVVIRELNKHKELHPRQQIKERAAKVIKKLLSLFKTGSRTVSETDINSNIKIRLEDREPGIDFTKFQLDRNVQDDQLIASILTYKNENPGTDIILVTSDSGLLLIGKAKRLDIIAIELANELKLADEPDLNQTRIGLCKRR